MKSITKIINSDINCDYFQNFINFNHDRYIFYVNLFLFYLFQSYIIKIKFFNAFNINYKLKIKIKGFFQVSMGNKNTNNFSSFNDW